jgi:hypothetical protein
MGGVEYQVTKVDPTDPHTKGAVYQVHKVSEEIAATLGGKVYRARIIKDPTAPTVAGKVYQIVLIGDPDDPAVKGKVYNAILTGGSEAVVVGPAVSPLALDDAVADTMEYVKAYGGTEQRNLPDGYTQLEYIESTGTQYIDLGYKGNGTTKAEIKFKYHTATSTSGSGRVFGSRNAAAVDAFAIGSASGTASTSSTIAFFFGNQSYLVTDKSVVLDEWLSVIFDKTTHNINGTDYGGPYNDETFETPQNLKLFGFDNSGTMGYGYVDIAYCKLWDNGVLVRDLVPAKNSSNVIGMYDRANNRFYDNDGTGDFVAGTAITPTPDTPMDIVSNNGVLKARHESGLPLGYTLLDYIETDGASWFATGINIDATTELEITASNITSASAQLMVARTINTGKYFRLAKATATQRLIGSIGSQTITDTNNDGANKFTAKVNISGFYVDGTLIGNFESATPDLSEMTEVDVFKGTYGSNTYYAYAGSRLHRATIRKNCVAVIDLLPCKNSSNVVGAYDLVSGQFFTNAGTGDFVAGTAVSDPVGIYTDGTVETIGVSRYYDSADGQGTFVSPSATNTTRIYKAIGKLQAGHYKIKIASGFEFIFQYKDTMEGDPTNYGNIGTWTNEEEFDVTDTSLFYGVAIRHPNNSAITPSDFNGTITLMDTANTATAKMLLKVGDYQDEQEILAGDVTRKVGVKVLDGTEEYAYSEPNTYGIANITSTITGKVDGNTNTFICSHFVPQTSAWSSTQTEGVLNGNSNNQVFFRVLGTRIPNLSAWQQWLADQYNAGTPVIIVYPLATPITESVAGQPLQTVDGDNVLEITQASIDGLELEAEYEKEAA